MCLLIKFSIFFCVFHFMFIIFCILNRFYAATAQQSGHGYHMDGRVAAATPGSSHLSSICGVCGVFCEIK